MSRPILFIGNKNYSSWSMRAWLALRWADIDFEERVIPLGGPGYGKSTISEILAVSPSGRVPALHVDNVVIYDSLAICEWANENAPEAGLWPSVPRTRAQARSASAEMHAGFAALRRDLSMNIRRRMTRAPALADDVRADLQRLFEAWTDLRGCFASEGPFLFGKRTIADAMFAPVATRLRTYAIPAPPVAAAYVDAVLSDPAVAAWCAAGEAETWRIAQTEDLYS